MQGNMFVVLTVYYFVNHTPFLESLLFLDDDWQVFGTCLVVGMYACSSNEKYIFWYQCFFVGSFGAVMDVFVFGS